MAEAPEAPPPPPVGARVTLHGLATAPALNGARGVVVAALDGVTGRVGVRLTAPPGATSAHAAAPLGVRPARLAACGGEALREEFETSLAPHLSRVLSDASEALQLELAQHEGAAAARRGGSSGSSGSGGKAAAALRFVCAQCAEALRYVDDAAAHPLDAGEASRAPLALQYAFLHAVACANLAQWCAARRDAGGALDALTSAHDTSLQRPKLARAAAALAQPRLVQQLALRAGEGLRASGRHSDALAPLQLAAAVAASEADAETEAAARGTLSLVLLALGDAFGARDAGAAEVKLLEAQARGGGGGGDAGAQCALALARARASLANVHAALAAAAADASPERADALRAAEALLPAAQAAADSAAAAPPAPHDDAAAAAAWTSVRASVASARSRIAELRADAAADVSSTAGAPAPACDFPA
jgi:hypothetical protein